VGTAAQPVPNRTLITVREAGAADIDALAALRLALWPDEPLEVRRAEAEANVERTDGGLATFMAEVEGEVIAFAEVSLRRDYVNGCETSPVAFLEGIYIRPERRRQGVGRALVAAAEQWGRAQGCSELASDALLDNHASHRFHAGAGFEETERVVYFRKRL
jgi:aminoglycoside 6'-N-acetyltransferase I